MLAFAVVALVVFVVLVVLGFSVLHALRSVRVARVLARIPGARFKAWEMHTPARFCLSFGGWLRLEENSATLTLPLVRGGFSFTYDRGSLGNRNGLTLSISGFPFFFRNRKTGKIQRLQSAWATLKLRTSYNGETTVYCNGWSFWWNSGHLAVRLGKFVDTDFGGYWRWRKHMQM